jgi:hypothetical protein
MAAIATRDTRLTATAVAIEAPHTFAIKENLMRERLVATRDTLIVLGLQIVFRVALVLRRWNY